MNVKLTLQLSADLRMRLAYESAETGKSNSKIVAELIDKHVDMPGTLEDLDAYLAERSPARPVTASGRHGKNTSLYLPAKAELRLHVHGMKTGEDRKSTIIRLITQHIPPRVAIDPLTTATYNPLTHVLHSRPGLKGRLNSEAAESHSDAEAA